MGLLDILQGNYASPWGALYQVPPQSAAPTPDAAAAYGMLGVDPSALNGQNLPRPNPFPDVGTQPPAATAARSPFDGGAAPFGFASAGSNIVNPADIATPAPVPMPQPRPAAADAPPAPAASPTDVSSVNRGAGYAAGPVAPGAVNAPAATSAAPNAAPPVAAPAPFSLGGAGDRLAASLQSFNNTTGGGLLGKLTNGVSGLITGQRADPAGQALQLQGQADNATAQALRSKGVDQQTVQAAIAASRAGQPDMLKTLIAQNFGPDKFQHVTRKDETGAETAGSFDPATGKYNWEAVSASATGGTVTGPDGKQIVIPPGVNRKEFIKRLSETAADVASGKMTEAQAKASSYASRMEKAQADLATLQNEGLSATQAVTSSLPGVGNYLQSDNHQRFETAKSAFITALLRQESGAAINKNEFTRYEKELFPQPGDSTATVQQKAQLRSGALDQMRRAAGPGYQSAPAPAANGLPQGWSVQVH